MSRSRAKNRAAVSAGFVLALALSSLGCGGNEPAGPSKDASTDTAPGVPVVVSAYVGSVASNLAFVAAQDGTGEWHALDGKNGSYTLEVTSDRYGLAYVCPEIIAQQLLVEVTVELFTTNEEPNRTIGCPGSTVTHEVEGLVSGLNGGHAELALGDELVVTDGAYSTSVADGMFDFVAVRKDDADHADRIIIDRNVHVSYDIIKNFNFAMAGVALEPRTATVWGGQASDMLVTVALFVPRSGGTASNLARAFNQIQFVPEAALEDNDIHKVQAVAFAADGKHMRWMHHLRRTASDEAFVLPSLFEADVDCAESDASQLRYRVRFDSEAGAAMHCFFSAGDSAAGVIVNYTLDVGAGWLGSAGSKSITLPLLEPLPGWNELWNPIDGVATEWVCSRFRSNRLSEMYRDYFGVTLPGPVPSGLDGLEVEASAVQDLIVP